MIVVRMMLRFSISVYFSVGKESIIGGSMKMLKFPIASGGKK